MAMEHTPPAFDAISEPLQTRVSAGLARIGTAIRAHGWKGAGPVGLTPTQGAALVMMTGERAGLRLSALAASLAITPATASDALGSLVRKGLVARGHDPADARAAAFTQTPEGASLAERIATWPDFLARAIGTLDPAEQAALHRMIIKTIRALQEAGDIPVQRMCVTCRYFRPGAHPDDPDLPHECAYVGAAFGDRHLRLDCREQVTLAAAERMALWVRFLAAPNGGASDKGAPQA